jgi:hypothetical protein
MIDETGVVREKCRIREHLFGPEQSGVPEFLLILKKLLNE